MMHLRRIRRLPLLNLLYKISLKNYEGAAGPVEAHIHGYPVKLNPGNNYPFIVQDFPDFNAPLVELVHQTFKGKQTKLCFLDIGAATGDTVLLLKQKCGDFVKKWICIEGDREFLSLLRGNMAQFKDVAIVDALLARHRTKIPSLVKPHRGTAAALGSEFVDAVPLDSIPTLQNERIDVLKIDVDGFDGEVLSGSTALLKRDLPTVIFEWHPQLAQQMKHDPLAAFDTLKSCGYEHYLWFNNIGTFSHFSERPNRETLLRHAEYLIKVHSRADAHFDVVALPPGSKLDQVELAAMEFARSRKS
jgi:FkbM family methyltransferase